MPKLDPKKKGTARKKKSDKSVVDDSAMQASAATPWANPWDDELENLMNSAGSPTRSPRVSPQERISMIEKVFEEVLDRKPDTRDLNYYKYSTLSEDEIRKQLLAGKEHRKLIEEGREYKKMKERAIQAETRVKMLDAQNQDQLEEFKQLTSLLKEKNAYIQKLREELKNPYNMTTSVLKPITPISNGNPGLQGEADTIYSTPTNSKKTVTKENLFTRIRDLIQS